MAPKRSSTGSTKRVSKGDEDAAVATSSSSEQEARFAKVIVELSEKVPEKARPYVQKAAPILAKLMVFCIIATPYVLKAVKKIDEVMHKLPLHLFRALIGLVICFFGGVFPLTIAAVEAWKACGGDEAVKAIKELRHEFTRCQEAFDKDDQVDADGDGVADVNQITGKELMERKLKIALKVVKPETVSTQVTLLYTGWIGVVATLKIQFAKTIALGAAIGQRLYEPTQKYLEPTLLAMCPEEYVQWVPYIVKWGCKAIAVYIAWWIQRIISAFHSAIRGGLMCGKELVIFANDKGWIQATEDETYLDEIVGWGLAAFGFMTQMMLGFSVPFPLSLFMWPLYMVEAFIAWTINS